MIHSLRVIERIAELIKLAGVSSDDKIQEMTDHYLSEIEHTITLGSSEQKAIRETYQTIARTDLKSIDQNEKKKTKWIFGIISIALICLYFTFQCKNTPQSIATFAKEELVEIPNGWPIDSDIDQITSGFGVRTHPVSNTKRFHKGIDIKASKGTPVLVTGDGSVTEAGYNPSSGYYVIIKHNEQYSTRYLHLSKVEIANAQMVEKGDIIGLVGNSGISLTPHLHYEVIKNDFVMDPMEVIAP